MPDLNWSLLAELLVNGVIVGTLYGVVAMCFVLIYKASQVVNFAQGEFLLVGAWSCWWLLTTFPELPFWLAFLITLAFMLAFGVLLQVVVLRPLIGEPVISVIMVTIGLSIIFRAAMNWMFGVFVQPYPQIFEQRQVEIFGLNVETAYIMSMAISIVVMVGFAWFFKYSKMGLAMRATAYDQQVAQSLGVSIRHVFALSWAISAMVSALAGVVIGIVNGVSSGLALIGIKVFPAVIVGGLDSIVGAVIGGLIIGLLENTAQFVGAEGARLTGVNFGNLYEIAPFYVLIIILMVRPYGLFGTEDIERV